MWSPPCSQVEDQLRKDLEKIAEEEAEGWKAVLDRRHALHDMVHMTEVRGWRWWCNDGCIQAAPP